MDTGLVVCHHLAIATTDVICFLFHSGSGMLSPAGVVLSM